MNNETAANRKTLKGKYLQPLQEFVDQIRKDAPLGWIVSDTSEALAKNIAKFHKEFLSEEEALALVADMGTSILPKYHRLMSQGAMSAIENNEINKDLVNALKNHIESFPRNYTICIELPGFDLDHTTKVQLSDRIALLTHTPLPKVARSIFQSKVQDKQGAVGYLELKLRGYASTTSESTLVGEACSLAKQVTFNMYRNDLFMLATSDKELRATITDHVNDKTTQLFLPHELQFCLGRLILNRNRMLQYLPRRKPDNLTNAVAKQAESDDEVIAALNQNLEHVRTYLAASLHEDFPSVSAAIEWYQDSLSTQNETFSYLAVCIGLEAILGSDETMLGMSKRLADRYGFLLGRGRTERESLAKDYTQILDVRGKLVHAKSARLAPDERALLRKARAMLGKVISHEIEAITTPTADYLPT